MNMVKISTNSSVVKWLSGGYLKLSNKLVLGWVTVQWVVLLIQRLNFMSEIYRQDDHIWTHQQQSSYFIRHLVTSPTQRLEQSQTQIFSCCGEEEKTGVFETFPKCYLPSIRVHKKFIPFIKFLISTETLFIPVYRYQFQNLFNLVPHTNSQTKYTICHKLSIRHKRQFQHWHIFQFCLVGLVVSQPKAP